MSSAASVLSGSVSTWVLASILVCSVSCSLRRDEVTVSPDPTKTDAESLNRRIAHGLHRFLSEGELNSGGDDSLPESAFYALLSRAPADDREGVPVPSSSAVIGRSQSPEKTLQVDALFPFAADWNQYVTLPAKEGVTQQSRIQDFFRSCSAVKAGADTDAKNTETQVSRDCFHAGAIRRVDTGQTSCRGLTLEDDQGWFQWRCVEPALAARILGTHQAVFVSLLNASSRLSDLIENHGKGARWKSNTVTLLRDGEPLRHSEKNRWWSNPIEVLDPPTANARGSRSPRILKSPGTIYLVSQAVPTQGLILGADRVALVVRPEAGLTLREGTEHTCLLQKEGGAPDIYRCLVAARERSFLWIEGALSGLNDGPGGALRPSTVKSMGLLLDQVSHARVSDSVISSFSRNALRVQGGEANVFHRVMVTGAGEAGIMLAGGQHHRLIQVGAVESGTSGIVIAGTEGGHLLHGVHSSFNRGDGVELISTRSCRLLEVRASNNGKSGIHIHGEKSESNVLSLSLAANNGADGILIDIPERRAPQVLTASTLVSNGGAGLRLSGVKGVIAHGLLVANSQTGFAIDHGGEHSFSNLAVAHASIGFMFVETTKSRFTGDIFYGSLRGDPAVVLGGDRVGLEVNSVAHTLQSEGMSDAVWHAGLDVSRSFAGAVEFLDESNLSNEEGRMSTGAGPLDWVFFENPMRVWSRSRAALGERSSQGVCKSQGDLADCRIHDWSLHSLDRQLLGVVLRGPDPLRGQPGLADRAVAASAAYAGDSECDIHPATGGRTLITSAFESERGGRVGQSFLSGAAERLADGRGDEDGLCESGEDCILMPQPGADLGSGHLLSCKTHSLRGALSDVALQRFERNGR